MKLCRNVDFMEFFSQCLLSLVPVTHSIHVSDTRIQQKLQVLTGVPEMVWPPNLRLCLAGLGQQASPLQSVWVGALLQCQADLVYYCESKLDPVDCLLDVRGRVLVLAEHLEFDPVIPSALPDPPVEDAMDLSLDDTSLTPWVHFSHKGRDDECTVVHYLDGVPFVSRLSDPDATVAAVLHTTNKFLGLPGTDLRVIDCSSGLNPCHGTPGSWHVSLDCAQPGSCCPCSHPP